MSKSDKKSTQINKIAHKNKKSTSRRTLRYFWEEAKTQKKYFLPLLIFMPAAIFLNNYATAWIISTVIDILTENPPEKAAIFSTFMPYLLLYTGAIIVGEMICWRLALWLTWKGETYGRKNLHEKTYSAIIEQSMHFHNNKFGGSLVAQQTRFVNSFERLADSIIWQIVPLASSCIFAIAILSVKLPLFALILAIFSAAFMLIAFFSFKKIRVLNEKEAASNSKLTANLADSVTNIAAVKSFAREKSEFANFKKHVNDTQNKSFSLMRAFLLRDVWFGGILAALAITTFVFLIGGNAWFGVPIGTLYLAFAYMTNMWGQLWQFNSIMRNVNRSLGDSQEMTQMLDEPILVQDNPNARKLQIENGNIEFQNISFHHTDTEEGDEIFREFSLTIPAGQRIGLVGHSGSGKTTLTKLLLRFADVQKGEILIDNQNIAKVTQNSLRKNIAYVPQEPMLFHRSISKNIAYGKPNADEAEIREAARRANALDFIEDLPEKFTTLVGERGVKLSGGQRQRIAIARAILADAPILVLDEATSALDTESEKLIQDALKNLMQNRTSIIIAHRLSTVAELDRIIVLDNGKIAEDGAHDKLLAKKNGTYAKLWNRQTGIIKE